MKLIYSTDSFQCRRVLNCQLFWSVIRKVNQQCTLYPMYLLSIQPVFFLNGYHQGSQQNTRSFWHHLCYNFQCKRSVSMETVIMSYVEHSTSAYCHQSLPITPSWQPVQPILSHFSRCLDYLHCTHCLHTHHDYDLDMICHVFIVFCELWNWVIILL